MNIKVNRIDDHLKRHIEKFVDYKYDPNETFSELLKNLKIVKPIGTENIIVTRQVVRYIIRNNQCEWYVPFTDLTVKDYLETYPATELEIEEIDGIGCLEIDYILVMNFLSALITIIGGGYHLFKFIWNMIANWEKKKWAKEFHYKDSYILPDDLMFFLHSRKEWEISELQKMINISDKQLLNSLLYVAGFERQKHGLYLYNKNLDDENRQQIKSLTSENINKQIVQYYSNRNKKIK